MILRSFAKFIDKLRFRLKSDKKPDILHKDLSKIITTLYFTVITDFVIIKFKLLPLLPVFLWIILPFYHGYLDYLGYRCSLTVMTHMSTTNTLRIVAIEIKS